ncbi:MAG: energy-coupled thiamine transporter ThiT [Clostridia bacterium]|nr:energy-coupled thiamine transporter ThiT [Clostridia bacterium]MBQ4574327.1 energy-coupled thiamine transporter ThiT [Clostridia bacterium]
MLHRKTTTLVECAIMLALSVVLSFVKVWEMPLGGSITLLSMLPISLISIKHGIKWGVATSFVYALLQLFLDIGKVMTWGLTAEMLIGCLLYDYLFAFTAIGLAGLFRSYGRGGMCVGIGLALFLRFVSHFISGGIVFAAWCPEEWSNPLLYSVCYNGAYMLPEMILTMAATLIISKLPTVKRLVYPASC